MSATVGIVGLGPMGLALALHLGDAGFSPVGTSRSEATRGAAQDAGIDVVADARAVAKRVRGAREGSDRPGVVVTSLPAGPQVRAACLGDAGLLADPLGADAAKVREALMAATRRAGSSSCRASGCSVATSASAARSGTM